MARTVSGTVFWTAVAAVTGTATGAALCAFCAEQPDRPAMASPIVITSSARLRSTLPLSPIDVLMRATILRRDTMAIRFCGRRHSAEPDIRQLGTHRFRIELLVHAAAEDLLHQVVVEDHPHESARGEQRIHSAKRSLVDAALDVCREDAVVIRHVRLEEAVRQAMVLE